MIGDRVLSPLKRRQADIPYIGTPGRLCVLAWSVLLVLLAPPEYFWLSAGLSFALNSLLYPGSIKRLFQWRWLLFSVLLILPSLLWAGENGWQTGLFSGLQMVVRALVVIMAVDGFTSAVDIAEIAGLFERIGLPGLGFSMGVAVNLLPALRQSSQCAWRSLRMRGGFRRRWRRGLQLLLVTIITNALRRAEEIALAAEIRAFSPDHYHALPLKQGRLDRLFVFSLVIVGTLMVAYFLIK